MASKKSPAKPDKTSPAPSALDSLVRLLDLEPLEVNLFRGLSPQIGW